jgi:hypothetical protein
MIDFDIIYDYYGFISLFKSLLKSITDAID